MSHQARQHPPLSAAVLGALLEEILDLRTGVINDATERLNPHLKHFPEGRFSDSAQNLAHYLAFRRHDLRPLQEKLARAGLPGLDDCEPHVLDTLNRIAATLARALGADLDPAPRIPSDAPCRLTDNARNLFGPDAPEHAVRIMVTLPREAAEDGELVRELIRQGMDCARIKCAHDGETVWKAMAAHVRAAAAAEGRECKILMDLAGHKIRTGPLERQPAPVTLRLRVGEKLLLKSDLTPGRPARRSDEGEEIDPAEIGCTHAEAVQALAPGDLVWIDDGRLGAVVMARAPGGALLSIVHARGKGAQVRAEKTLDFPCTDLNLPPLSQKDLRDLDTVVSLADMVGFSYVETLGDMECLMAELAKRGKPGMPIVAKIETPRVVRHLPEMLLGTLGRHPLGVMVVHGDLATELGGAHPAAVHDEVLRLCKAAHVPVIRATQVTEKRPAKDSRLSFKYTGDAFGRRAECVLLNKGAYILETLRTLTDILQHPPAPAKRAARLRAVYW